MQGSHDVTISKDGSVKAKSSQVITKPNFRAKGVTDFSQGRDGGLDFSAQSLEDGDSTFKNLKGRRKLGQVLSIRQGESLSSQG